MGFNGIKQNTSEDQAADKEYAEKEFVDKEFTGHIRAAGMLKNILNEKGMHLFNHWIEKFYEMDSTAEEQKLRNAYLRLLRAQLETGYLNAPFLNFPPEGQLGPINKSDLLLYSNVMNEDNPFWRRSFDSQWAQQQPWFSFYNKPN